MTQRIQDDGHAGKYFSMMLHIADEDLDPFEYRLLGHYVRVCGQVKKPCTEGLATTAKACKMSVAKARDARNALRTAGYIDFDDANGRTVNVTIVDRMAENIERISSIKNDRGKASTPTKSDSGSVVHTSIENDRATPIKNDIGGQSEPLSDSIDKEYINTNNNQKHSDPKGSGASAPEPSGPTDNNGQPDPGGENGNTQESGAVTPTPSSGKVPPLPQPHVLVIQAWHGAIPEAQRPVGKPNYSRNVAVAKELVEAGIAADQVGGFVRETYPSYLEWARGQPGRPQVMSLEHVKQNIRAWISKPKAGSNETTSGRELLSATDNPTSGVAEEPEKRLSDENRRILAESRQRAEQRRTLSDVFGDALPGLKPARGTS